MLESPKKGLEARFKDYKDFAKNHPVFVTLIAIWCIAQPMWSVINAVKGWESDSLNEKIKDQERTISNQKIDIQRLETILVPFKTVALERYTGSEAEVLAKLAIHISDIENSLKKAEENLAIIKPQASYAWLRGIANIRPDGWEVVERGSKDSGVIRTFNPSAIAKKAQDAFHLMNNKDSSALKHFADISSEMPEWPYAYYYSGIVSGDESYFKEAVVRFEALRRAQIVEPEALLFEAMALTFMQKYKEADECLAKLDQTGRNPQHVPAMGIDLRTPPELLAKFTTIAKTRGLTLGGR